MVNTPVQQAMLAIQQAKMAVQQGLKRVDPEQFAMVETQLQHALQTIDDAKLKASSSEGQLLLQADLAVESALKQLKETNHPPNLQNG